MTLQFTDLSRILFIDIETVPESANFEDIDQKKQDLWRKKASKASWTNKSYTDESEAIAQSFCEKAGIYAEFSKVVCISLGYFVLNGNDISCLKVKSFYSDNEAEVLMSVSDVLNTHYNNPDQDHLCGHNLKEFDVPFLCRRLLINRIALPKLIDVAGAKPWQTSQLIDTLQLWKFGDYKNYTSLDLIASALNLPSPKIEMNGSEVRDVYYEHRDLDKIVRYCEQDVFTTARVFLALNGLPDLNKEQFHSQTF
jgi:DNA polymerase elongation subunit (family B)